MFSRAGFTGLSRPHLEFRREMEGRQTVLGEKSDSVLPAPRVALKPGGAVLALPSPCPSSCPGEDGARSARCIVSSRESDPTAAVNVIDVLHSRGVCRPPLSLQSRKKSACVWQVLCEKKKHFSLFCQNREEGKGITVGTRAGFL